MIRPLAPAGPASRGNNAPKLIYLSPVPWKSYAQRPHFMARHFLEAGGREVLWINPYPGRFPRVADLRRTPRLLDQGTPSVPGVRVLDFRCLPLEPLPGGVFVNLLWNRRFSAELKNLISEGDCVLGIGKPSALALSLLTSVRHSWSFYDAMDDFPEFHSGISRRAMADREARIAERVDVILVSSAFLGEKFSKARCPVHLVPNACDTGSGQHPGPDGGARAVFGYIGAIAAWFDWQSVIALAQAAPEAEVRLIGPCLLPPPRDLPANILLLPPCRHDEVGRHLAGFRVGLIPFRQSPLTRGVDPIKFYEYRSAGLPVLSTTFGEMARRGEPEGVFFLDGPGGLEAAVRSALGFRADPDLLRRWRAENSWTNRLKGAPLAGGGEAR